MGRKHRDHIVQAALYVVLMASRNQRWQYKAVLFSLAKGTGELLWQKSEKYFGPDSYLVCGQWCWINWVLIKPFLHHELIHGLVCVLHSSQTLDETRGDMLTAIFQFKVFNSIWLFDNTISIYHDEVGTNTEPWDLAVFLIFILIPV